MEVSMKVLMINGSPHETGCTYTALREVATSLEKQGVESEILWIGKGSIHGCSACGSCKTTGVCIFTEDLVTLIPTLFITRLSRVAECQVS